MATSGKIGGFEILRDYLSYNGQTWGGTNTTGGYFGIHGIQLGKNFKVDMQGNLQAASGTFWGSVRAGNVQYGGDAGYFNGGGLKSGSVYGGSSGAISGGSISTFNTSGGINTSLGYADWTRNVMNGIGQFLTMTGSFLGAKNINLDGKRLVRKTIDYKMASGANGRMQVVCWE